MTRFVSQTIAEIRRDFAAGKSPVTLVEECLQRIEDSNATFRAMIFVGEEDALNDARRAERELRSGQPSGALHGIPIAIKDVIDVKGWPTTSGSKAYQGHIAERDAACIANLRAAGAIIIGKTNLHELTTGGHENPWFGTVVNPLDASRGTGGTSSGSAAAVAAGYCMAAIGTDTGGSNRSTAAATGLYGFKPSNGIMDHLGVRPTAPSLDTIGPIASSIDDTRLIHFALRGMSAPKQQDTQVSGLRIGVCADLYASDVDPIVTDAHDRWLTALSKAGASVLSLRFDRAEAVKVAGLTILSYEFAREYRDLFERQPENVGTAVLDFLSAGLAIDEASYRSALAFREDFRDEFIGLISAADVLATPVAPGLAPRLTDEKAKVGSTFVPYGLAGGNFRRWANFFGLPTLAMPLAAGDALPASIQISTRPGTDDALFSICQALVRAGKYPA